MGDGERVASKMLRTAVKEGHWLCLKNVHLSLGFMNHLEIQLQSFDKIHKNFRLWMTAEYHPDFPIGILKKSVKIVCEGPSGIQENIRQTHFQWKEKRLTKISTIDCKEKSNLLLILSWFHAIVQERKIYGPQGFTKKYEFNDGDLSCAAETLIENFVFKSDLNKIKQLLLDFVYGGKIDNNYDLRILETYINNYFCWDVLKGIKELFPGYSINQNEPSCFTCRRILSHLSRIDSPSLIGLPKNIKVAVNRNIGKRMIKHLKLMHFQTKRKITEQDKMLEVIIPVRDYWEKITGNKDICSEILEIFDVKNSFQNAIKNEILLGVELYHLVKSTLYFSDDTSTQRKKSLTEALIHGNVPDEWRKKWRGPSDPFIYLNSFVYRLNKIYKLERNM